MDQCKFFVESKADEKFIKDYCKEVFNKDLLIEDFDRLNGWSGYKAGGILKTSFLENRDNGKNSILILDADSDFQARLNEVSNDFINYKIPFDLFLFPNHADTGNLESLLTEIATLQELINCFLDYEKCVSHHPKKLNDLRIYSYNDLVNYPNYEDAEGNDLRRDEFRNYRNKNHWDLSHSYLDPLKSFLSKYLN